MGGTPTMEGEAAEEIESDIFVPPSPGPDPYQAILKKFLLDSY